MLLDGYIEDLKKIHYDGPEKEAHWRSYLYVFERYYQIYCWVDHYSQDFTPDYVKYAREQLIWMREKGILMGSIYYVTPTRIPLMAQLADDYERKSKLNGNV